MKNKWLKHITLWFCISLLWGCGGPDDLPRLYDYIRATPAELVIELDTVAELAPTSTARSRLADALQEVLDKPSGVRIDAHSFLDSMGNDYVWTDAALRSLAESNFDLEVGPEAIKMHTLFVDGSYVGDTSSQKRLSLRISDTQIVIFAQTIDQACNGGVNQALPKSDRQALCDVSTLAAWLHGSGRLLGLVNDGLPMVGDHEDLTHKGFSANSSSVMHKTFEGVELIDLYRTRVLAGNNDVISFDAACIADINAAK